MSTENYSSWFDRYIDSGGLDDAVRWSTRRNEFLNTDDDEYNDVWTDDHENWWSERTAKKVPYRLADAPGGAQQFEVTIKWYYRPDSTYSKAYTSRQPFGRLGRGTSIEVPEAIAFRDAVLEAERKAWEDRPARYEDDAEEQARENANAAEIERARGDRPWWARPGEEDDPAVIDQRVRQKMGNPSNLIETLKRLKERAIRNRPMGEVGGQQGASDALIDTRTEDYDDFLKQELSIKISRINFNVDYEGRTVTHIYYNLDPELSGQDGPRGLIGENVAPSLQEEWRTINTIFTTGDLEGPSELDRIERDEEYERAKINDPLSAKEMEFIVISATIQEKFVELNEIRRVLIETQTLVDPVGEFPSEEFLSETKESLEARGIEWTDPLTPPFLVQRELNRYQAILGSPRRQRADGSWRGVSNLQDSIRSLRSQIDLSIFEGADGGDRPPPGTFIIGELEEARVDEQIEAFQQWKDTARERLLEYKRALDALMAEEEARVQAEMKAAEVGELLRQKEFIIVDSKQRSIEFKLPLEKNQKSIQIQVLRVFLGFEPSDGDLFDEQTKKRLMEWQDENANDMYDFALRAMKYDGPRAAAPSMREELASDYGRVTALSFNFMAKEKGLANALERVYDHNTGNVGEMVSELTPPDVPTNALGKRVIGDGKNPPWSDAKYHYYIYNTRATREDINSDNPDSLKEWYTEHAERALRESVIALCGHHARKKTWKVFGNRQEHKRFNSILQYQNKIVDKMESDQEFTMTVLGQDLAENLGFRDDDQVPKVDVLFGQSLMAGAEPRFANIQQFHGPTQRPTSTWKLEVRVRKDLFDTIPTIDSRAFTIGETIAKAREAAAAVRSAVAALPGAGAALNARKDEIANGLLDRASSVNKGMAWAKKNKKQAIEQGASAALGAAKKFSRDAEAAKQFGSGVGPLALSKKQQEAFIAQVEANQIDLNTYPVTVAYPLNEINIMIEKVAEMFDTFHQEVQNWRRKGGRLRPYVDMSEEAKHLRALIPALTSLLAANGYVKRDYLRREDYLEVQFSEVQMVRSVPVPPFTFGPTAGQPRPPMKISDIAGGAVLTMDYDFQEPNKDKKPLLQGTIALSQQYPFNVPRTMHYFMNLYSLHDLAMDGASCLMSSNILDPSINALDTMKKYTTPALVILPKDPKPIFDIETKIDIQGPIKRFEQKLKEDLDMQGSGPLAERWREGIIRVERNKTYAIVDPIPTVELCTLEALFDEFLNQFDFKALFCDYASCIPELPWPPHFNWDFNFTIPELPRIPSFDPMAIIIPRIELALADLLLAFLCGLVRGILQIIRFPDCQDLLEFGKAAWEDLWPAEKNGQKLKVMQDAATVIEEMDLPEDAFINLADLFDDLAVALTPAELCSLLDGSADPEVIQIVLELIRTKHEEIAPHLSNEADVTNFFMLLGRFVDPDLCNKVSNISNVILGDVLCPNPNSNSSLRSRLESQKATSEEIARALADVAERREALKDLFNKDPLAGMVPKPGTPGMPGPYDNPLSKKMAEMAIKTVLENVEIMLKNDLVSFVPSLTDSSYSQMQPGDPGYDIVAAEEYSFLKQAIESMTHAEEDMADIVQEFEDWVGEVGSSGAARVFGGLAKRAVYNIAGYSVQRGKKRPTRYYVRRGPVDTGTAIPGGGVKSATTSGGGIHKERVLDVIRQDLARRNEGASKIPQPSTLVMSEEGEPYVTGLVDSEGEPIYFDLASPQDIKAIADILMFPLRNLSPNADIAPWLKNILDTDLTGLFRADTIRKKRSPALNFLYPNLQYESNPVQLRPREDRHFEIKLAITDDRREHLTYQEIPFHGVDVKDCYNIHRPARIRTDTGFVESWKGKTINEAIHEDIKNLRLAARDIGNNPEQLKLLRPGAFADMVLNSWSNLRLMHRNVSPSVDSAESRIFEKLQGFVSRNQVANDGTGFENAYEQMVESFNEKISKKVSQSRFFDLDQMIEMANLMTAEFIENEDAEGNICYVENEPFIDFEKIRKELVDKYTQSLSQSQHAPENRDFSKPGPLEESMGTQMCYLYIKTFVIEFMLRGVFVFSEFGPRSCFKSEMVKDFFTDFLLSSINSDMSIDTESKEAFEQEMKKAGNNTDLRDAVRTLVSQFTADEDFMSTVERIFQPENRSFKEAFFYELLGSEKNVSSLKHIAPSSHDPSVGTRRGFVPLHHSFNGPLGYDDEEGLKNLNQGMFYLESYYRFSQDIIDEYITPENSLMRRLIRRDHVWDAAAQALGNTLTTKFYSIHQFTGVFSSYELDALLKVLYTFTRFGEGLQKQVHGASWEEISEQFLRDLARPGRFKAGLRLVYLPGKAYAPDPNMSPVDLSLIEEDIFTIIKNESAPNQEDFFENPVGADAFNGPWIPLSDFKVPDDAPAYYEYQAARSRSADGDQEAEVIVRQWEAANRAEELARSRAIEEFDITSKTRAYVADTTPRYGSQRAPRLDVRSHRGPIAKNAARRALEQNEAYAYGYSHIVLVEDGEFINDGEEATVDRRGNVSLVGQREPVEVSYAPGKPGNIMFPTPIVEKEVNLCFADLLNADADDATAAVRASLPSRRAAKNNVRAQMFGNKFINEGTLGDDAAIEIKYLFDFIFPLDRYQALFLIQNQIMMDSSGDLATLLDPTRGIIKKLALTLRDASKFGVDKTPSNSKIRSVLISDVTSDGPGPKAQFALGDLAPQIVKMAAMTIPTLIRGQAAYLDPAYKQLKKQFETDVCKMKAGMTPRVLKPGLTYSPPWTNESGDQLTSGFDSDGAYAPLNVHGVLDMQVVMGMIGNPFMVGTLPHNIGEFIRIVEHLSNAVTSDTGENSYGKFLSPVGMLAMGMPELQGEQYRIKKREAKCRNGEKTAPDFKVCDDEQEEQEE